MPKARRLGNYLKAADIGGSGGTHLVQLMSAGEKAEPSDFRPDRALEIPVTPHTPPEWATGGNEPKTWSLNRTSENTLLDQIGGDTEDWMDKLIRINVERQKVMGTMRDVLYAEEEPEEQPEETPSPPTKPKAKTAATPTAAKGEPLTFTEAETRWIRYNELLIETVIDPQDWQSIPKNVRQGLQAKGVLIDQDGYPYLTKDARQALG